MATTTVPKTSTSIAELRAQGATTTVEVARSALGLSKAAAYRAVKSGAIPTIRIGKAIRVPVDQLIAMIEGAA